MMKKDAHASVGLYTIAVAALFLAGFLLMVIFGAQIYRKAVVNSQDNSRLRALNAYITTCVRGGDAEGHVYVENRAEGPVLVIADGDTGYGIRIFQKDSIIMEDYGRLDSACAPDKAGIIGESAVFQVDDSDSLLTVTTDGGTVCVTRRSERY